MLIATAAWLTGATLGSLVSLTLTGILQNAARLLRKGDRKLEFAQEDSPIRKGEEVLVTFPVEESAEFQLLVAAS